MKKSIITLMMLSAVGLATAQDLDTVTITDQFSVGRRGNTNGSLTSGGVKPDGTEFLVYSGADQSSPAGITYINSYARETAGALATQSVQDAANGETPVMAVTALKQTDRDLAIPSVVANTQLGATTPSDVLVIADDGGHNGLFFGQSDDKNYYVEVDIYAYDQSALTTAQMERVSLVSRAARDNDPTQTDSVFNHDRAGSYSITYDYMTREIKVGKWTTGNTSANLNIRAAGTFTQSGSTLSSVAVGWHRFRIEAKDKHIVFTVDGAVVADIVDSSFTAGRPGLGFREASVVSANERVALFDNLKAGPSTITNVDDWSIYN